MFIEIGKLFLKHVVLGALDGLVKGTTESAGKLITEIKNNREEISICDNKDIKYTLVKKNKSV